MNAYELKMKRKEAVDEARTILDKADEEKRGLNEEESKKYDELRARIDELTKSIEEREKLDSFNDVELRDQPGRDTKKKAEKREESVLDTELRELGESIMEKRDYTSAMNSGIFQKTEIETKVREGIAVLNPIRDKANVTTTASNLEIPVDGGDVSVDIISESGEYPDGGGSLKNVKFKPIKIGAIVKHTDESLVDLAPNLAQNTITQLVRATAKKENNWFMVGNGTTQPEGILTGASLGKLATGTTEITTKELREYIASLDSSLMPFAVGFCNKTTIGNLMDLTDKNKGIESRWDSVLKCYVVQGIPFYLNAYMPDMAAGEKPIVIGDVQNYYEIKDRTGFEVKVLAEKYADFGKIGYRFTFRSDAHVMDSEAFKYFQMAAS